MANKIIGGVTATTMPFPSKAEGYHHIGDGEFTNTHGIVTTNDLPDRAGLRIEGGYIQVEPATEGMILAQTSDMSFDHGINAPIVPKTVNYAVKMGLTKNHLTFNEYEKKRARELIGVDDSAPVPSFKPYNDENGILADAALVGNGELYVLWVGSDMMLFDYGAAITALGSCELVQFTVVNGAITGMARLGFTNAGVSELREQMGDIATALDSILAMQEALIGGGV